MIGRLMQQERAELSASIVMALSGHLTKLRSLENGRLS